MNLALYCPAAFGIQEAFAISDFIMDVMVILAPIGVVSLSLSLGQVIDCN